MRSIDALSTEIWLSLSLLWNRSSKNMEIVLNVLKLAHTSLIYLFNCNNLLHVLFFPKVYDLALPRTPTKLSSFNLCNHIKEFVAVHGIKIVLIKL